MKYINLWELLFIFNVNKILIQHQIWLGIISLNEAKTNFCENEKTAIMILLWSQQLCRNSPKIWTHLVDYIAALLHPLIQGWCLGIKITNVKLYAKFFFNWKGDRIFHQEIAWWQKTNDHFRVSQRIRIRLGSYSTLIIGPVCVFLFIYFLLARALLLYQTRLVAFLWWC